MVLRAPGPGAGLGVGGVVRPLREPFEAELHWSDFGGVRPQFLIEPDRTVLLENGPWREEPRGWFVVGYGPFRRLGGNWSRPVPVPGAVSRLANLFGEDASLAEGRPVR